MQQRRRFTVPLPGGRSLALGERTLLMGILNATPDSFSDGGKLRDASTAIDVGMRMVDEGATCSTSAESQPGPAPSR
jgi:dihydropteroate synthase